MATPTTRVKSLTRTAMGLQHFFRYRSKPACGRSPLVAFCPTMASFCLVIVQARWPAITWWRNSGVFQVTFYTLMSNQFCVGVHSHKIIHGIIHMYWRSAEHNKCYRVKFFYDLFSLENDCQFKPKNQKPLAMGHVPTVCKHTKHIALHDKGNWKH